MTKWLLRFRDRGTDRIIAEELFNFPEIPRFCEEEFGNSKYFEVTVTAISVE